MRMNNGQESETKRQDMQAVSTTSGVSAGLFRTSKIIDFKMLNFVGFLAVTVGEQ